MFKATLEFIRRHKRKKILKNTFDTLRLIKFLSHLTGFRVFEYPQGHSRPKLSFLYMISLCILHYIGWYYQGFMLEIGKSYNLQETIYQITDALNHMGMFVILVIGWYQSKSMKLCVRKIHEIDVTLRELGSPGTFNNIYKKMIGIVIIILLQLTFISTLHTFGHLINFSKIYTTITIISVLYVRLYNLIVQYVLLMELFVIISCIDSEFQRANDLLGEINVLPLSSIAMELLDHENSKGSFTINKSFAKTSSKLFTILPSSRRLCSHLQMTSHEIIRTRRLLQTIRHVHLELCRVSKCISMIYGMQTAVEMSVCILYMTYFIYFTYCIYQHLTNNYTMFIATVTITSIICFNNLAKIFSINYICEKTSQKVQRTSEIIYTFYGENTDSELQEEVEMFCLQMIHCQFEFSAAGLYPLNYKTICGSIGVITTYVVIMIQVTSSIQEETS